MKHCSVHWAKANPLVTRALSAKRRAQKVGNGGDFTKADIHALLCSQLGLCAACAVQLRKFEVDHMHPLSLGGSSDVSNLQLLCVFCNRSKGNKLPHDFQRYRAQKQGVSSQGC